MENDLKKWMEDNLKKNENGRWPQFFENGRRPRFYLNGRRPKKKAILTNSTVQNSQPDQHNSQKYIGTNWLWHNSKLT